METTAHVTISTEQKIKNLRVALEALHLELRREGRYVAASHVEIAGSAMREAARFHINRSIGHD